MKYQLFAVFAFNCLRMLSSSSSSSSKSPLFPRIAMPQFGEKCFRERRYTRDHKDDKFLLEEEKEQVMQGIEKAQIYKMLPFLFL